MGRRRSASLTRSVFRTDAASPTLDPTSSTTDLDALAFAGFEGSGRSRAQPCDENSPPSADFQQACEVQVVAKRDVVLVRKAKPSSHLNAPRRPVPKRSMTRLVPLAGENGASAGLDNPFEDAMFRKTLQLAGFLQPMDTSRKTIKGRFSHSLQKEHFKEGLNAFLEEQGLKPRGEYMIRFKGTPAEPHSPFVHLFTTSLPASTATCKVYPEDVEGPEAATVTWTFLSAEQNTSEWAAKARKFWPVRVQLEGPTSVDFIPDTEQPDPSTYDGFSGASRRRKRRDSFHREIDLDEEIRAREQAEALELRDNTQANSLRLSETASLKITTKGGGSSSLAETERSAAATAGPPAEEQLASPKSPTILASVRQLGESIAHDPRVQSVTQTVTSGVQGLREWFSQRQLPSPFSDEVEQHEEEEERRKREKRRRRREREEMRKRRELEDGAAEDDLEREREERRARREERRRRREMEGRDEF
ncbi:uncharacterized protein JCM10292_007563 [Rhodotorula paludigena]|uniref:uncharacterized protein n=1 Tax=Rhodotorula paludigena TaxID=86838 RepID=UPI003177B6C1